MTVQPARLRSMGLKAAFSDRQTPTSDSWRHAMCRESANWLVIWQRLQTWPDMSSGWRALRSIQVQRSWWLLIVWTVTMLFGLTAAEAQHYTVEFLTPGTFFSASAQRISGDG